MRSTYTDMEQKLKNIIHFVTLEPYTSPPLNHLRGIVKSPVSNLACDNITDMRFVVGDDWGAIVYVRDAWILQIYGHFLNSMAQGDVRYVQEKMQAVDHAMNWLKHLTEKDNEHATNTN